MNIIYYTSIDFSKKNGQAKYCFHVFSSLLNQEKLSVHLISPNIKDQLALANLEKQYHFMINIVKTEQKRRNKLWFLIYQITSFFYLLKAGKKDALIFSLKPYSIAPLIYAKFFRVPIFLLVEGRVDLNIDKLFENKIQKKISHTLVKTILREAEFVYPAYEDAKNWVNEIRNSNNYLLCRYFNF